MFFSPLAHLAPPAPDFGPSIAELDTLVWLLNYTSQPWKVRIFFPPEHCGILYVRPHNFVFVFRVRKIVLHLVLNIL